MTSTQSDNQSHRQGLTRRQLLLGGAVAGAGAVAAVGIDFALNNQTQVGASPPPQLNGDETIPFYGIHQAGIDTSPQTHAEFLSLDLRADTDREGLRRMMRILTDDAARLTQGSPALADSEPELAKTPARLTITFGFGAELIARAQGQPPEWLQPLPSFSIDRLQPEYSDGDLLIQIASDDPLSAAHASRMLLKDSRRFATVRWIQSGFRRAYGTEMPGTTMRNLFGQVDGTTNPRPGTNDFDLVVWNTTGWLAGGTSLVIRRIHMNLDKWDHLDRSGRDQSVGRYQSNGAPLTSNPTTAAAEFDEPDFNATNAMGFPVIPEYSHIVRARSDDPQHRIFRRSYNYDDRPINSEISNSGQIFVSFQADVDDQFVPIQRRLDELDLLNEWTTPIGSAVFAIPPGCNETGFVGDTLIL